LPFQLVDQGRTQDNLMHQVWGGAEFSSGSYTSGTSGGSVEKLDKYDNIQWNSISDSTDSASHQHPGQVDARAPEEPLPNGVLSRGSIDHESGKCSPCHYFHSKAGCKNGSRCSYCHMHGKDFRPRPCRAKRAKAKSLAGILDELDNPGDLERCAAEMESKGGYLKVVVQSKLRQQQQQQKEETEAKIPSKPPHRRNIICL